MEFPGKFRSEVTDPRVSGNSHRRGGEYIQRFFYIFLTDNIEINREKQRGSVQSGSD